MTTATEGLLAALRLHTNRPTLTWSSPPAPLAGGFWAEMYSIELADPPNELDGRLVARIMPDPDTAAFETSVQRYLTHCGFPVPTIRCAGGPSSELDRAWSVMEFAAGQPPLAGLSAADRVEASADPASAPARPSRRNSLSPSPVSARRIAQRTRRSRPPTRHSRPTHAPRCTGCLHRASRPGAKRRTSGRVCARQPQHLPRRPSSVQPARRRRPLDLDRLVQRCVRRPPLRPRVHHADARQPSPRRAGPNPGSDSCDRQPNRQPVPAKLRKANRSTCGSSSARLGSPRPRTPRPR